jgi:nucleoside-diphosphate-sugar epimerase
MNVLVTGAFGNIGSNAVRSMLALGHRVRGLSADWPKDRALATSFTKLYGGQFEAVRGDLRDASSLSAAVAGQDIVVHLAYVIPPRCLERPDESRAVNVGGTTNLIGAMRHEGERAGRAARLLFASSLDVYGHTRELPPPRRVDDPVQATDVYTEMKIDFEAMVRDSGLGWSIFRFADVPPIALRDPHPIMFTIPLDQRFEMIHPRDAGLAVARAVERDEIWGRVWNIGGGPRCQMTYGDYLAGFLEAMEIGRLPAEWFSTKSYCTDWLDSAESERLLEYQRHGYEDVVRETAALLGWRRPLVRLLRPIVRRRIAAMARKASPRRE